MSTPYDTEHSFMTLPTLTSESMKLCVATHILVTECLSDFRNLVHVAASWLEDLVMDHEITGPVVVKSVGLLTWEGKLPKEMEYQIYFFTTEDVIAQIQELEI